MGSLVIQGNMDGEAKSLDKEHAGGAARRPVWLKENERGEQWEKKSGQRGNRKAGPYTNEKPFREFDQAWHFGRITLLSRKYCKRNDRKKGYHLEGSWSFPDKR